MPSFIAQWFGILCTVLQLLIVATLVRKKLHARFPIFFSFLIYLVVGNFALTVLNTRISGIHYYALFWTLGAVGMILGLGITYEVFLNVLKSYPELLDFSKVLFRGAAAFLFAASLLTALATNGSGAAKICAGINLFNNTVELVQCGLLLLVILFQSRLGLSWRTPAVCIALGIGCYAFLDMGSSILTQHAPAWQTFVDGTMLVFNVLLFAGWMVVIHFSEPNRKVIQDAPARLILQRWNEVLLSTPLVARRSDELAFAPVDSFIPGVEKTVDRVLSRKMAAS